MKRTSFQPMCGTFSCGSGARRRTSPSSRPRPSAPPSSSERSKRSCIPRQSPSTGTPARARSASTSAIPLAVRRSMAAANAPTPMSDQRRRRARELVEVGGVSSRGRRRARAPSRPSAGCPSRSRRRAMRAARAALKPSASPSSTGRRSPSGRARRPARSARANALKHASIMWWAFVPASIVEVGRQPGVRRDRAEELLDELVVQAAGRPGRQQAASRARKGRPEMSIAHEARASSIGTTAWP